MGYPGEPAILAGDLVYPRTHAGLCLADVPCDGKQRQERLTLCVFRGEGRVLETRDYVIDYDQWEPLYEGIGKVATRNLLIECETGRGWAGDGAVVRAENLPPDYHQERT